MSFTFKKRRITNISLLVIASVIAIFLCYVLRTAHLNIGIYSGLVLYGIVLFLALFNSRKKAPFLPLLKVRTWLQLHIYLGLLAVVIFFIHIGWRLPNGALESVLAAVFVIVSVSGVLGLFFSRTLPARMHQSGEPLIYERIPKHRAQLKTEMEAVVQKMVKDGDNTVLSDIYDAKLHAFMTRIPTWSYCLKSVDPAYAHVKASLLDQKRYLKTEQNEMLDEALELLETKRNLDFQFSGMTLLRRWLFIHIPFSVSLLILGLAHGILVLLYSVRI